MVLWLAIWLELTMDRRAVTALEYGLIGGVIVATIVLGFNLLANSTSAKFAFVGSRL